MILGYYGNELFSDPSTAWPSIEPKITQRRQEAASFSVREYIAVI